jgi:hypothetical protein
MAVVQISRIQQRRGKKNSQTGFPQLASGELGWAIDTQELYIGNGAVSEGAPAVGNTKIITEHDNILALVDLYQYQKNNTHIQTGESTTMPIYRSLQDRLDDIVSVRAFGVVGDGIEDDTAAIQRAIDELFLNDYTKNNKSSRVILYFEPGVYKVSDEIRIPPFAHIVGSGIDSTVIDLEMDDYTGKSVFRTIDSVSTPGNYIEFTSMNSQTGTWPRKIYIANMTLQTNGVNAVMYVDNTESSVVERVRLLGVFTNNDPSDTNQAGVIIRGTSSVFSTIHVSFNQCIFNNTGYGVYSAHDHENVLFNQCVFYQLFDGINVGAGVVGSVATRVSNCHFDQIDRYGFRVKKGYANSSTNNTYMNVGNDNQNYANPVSPIVLFDSNGNTSTDDYFHRNTELKDWQTYNQTAFIPAVQTTSMIHDNTNHSSQISDISAQVSSVFPVMRFPIFDSAIYVIDYVISKTLSGTAIRSGTITVTLDVSTQQTLLKDNFDYTGSSTVENIKFSTAIENKLQDSFVDTLKINYYNPIGNGSATINYSYRMLSK